MRNLKAEIEYDGSNYCGWQVQKSREVKSIQEVIEKTLRQLLHEKIKLIVSGRTDAGVHALAQVANFKTNAAIALDKLQKALNSLLPADIKISQLKEVDNGFHSRFSAKSKIYRYSILNRPYSSPFLKEKVYFCDYPLNVRLMRQEARCLLGKHDFKSFCASGSKVKTTIRTIKKLTIRNMCCRQYAIGSKLIEIDIEADGFLYNMVRNIVGTLLDVGRGKSVPGRLKKILMAKNRLSAGPAAAACGLYLIKVKY